MEQKTTYDPKQTEQKWYSIWIEKKYFHSEPDKSKSPFTIVIPPPNVTGALHIGHALNNMLQDIITRYHRMAGDNALWVPGMDHGGIATQNVIEKMLMKEGKSRHDLGREKFLERMNAWVKETGGTILNQLKLLGCSCDWDRARFTKDDICSKAVYSAFKELFNEGLIYRGTRMINWCIRCHTALADIEVEYKESQGNLWYIRYPISGAANEYILVATTRPETMLGDTAVAVNPEDPRYSKYIGKKVKLPLTDYEIPIISDSVIDKEFGTGAVKVTPEHDLTDYEISERHNLLHRTVIAKTGKMTDEAGTKYAGLNIKECREKVVEDLKAAGLLEKVEPYTHSVAKCYRCGTSIEPLVSEQWFIKMGDIAKNAVNAINSGQVRFHPDSWKGPCLAWLENLKDWCISRQIWWGHRIPVWYCESCGAMMLSETELTECTACKSGKIFQDPDVLDTWFSSALWPFSVFGWPDETKELNYYYPTNVLVTGYEILYLWVARMIMMGLKFRKKVPYSDVYIHGIVRDIHGKKMSKSLGNVIDPLEIMDKYGTDALRFSLAMSAAAGRDIQLSEDSFMSARNFCNKIWNASRFIFMNLNSKNMNIDYDKLDTTDKWILSEFNETIDLVTTALNEYQIHEAARILYDFFWSKFCGWYLEFVKPHLKTDSEQNKVAVCINVLTGTLKLLHPVMPYITEELYQQIKETTDLKMDESIMVSNWIKTDGRGDSPDYKASKKEIEFLIKLITELRIIRTEMNIMPKQLIEMVINCNDKSKQEVISRYLPNMRLMVKVDKLAFSENVPEQSLRNLFTWPDATASDYYIPLKDVIDINKEKERILKTKEKLLNDLKNLQNKLNNQDFVSRAPKHEIERITSYLELTKNKLAKTDELYNQL